MVTKLIIILSVMLAQVVQRESWCCDFNVCVREEFSRRWCHHWCHRCPCGSMCLKVTFYQLLWSFEYILQWGGIRSERKITFSKMRKSIRWCGMNVFALDHITITQNVRYSTLNWLYGAIVFYLLWLSIFYDRNEYYQCHGDQNKIT